MGGQHPDERFGRGYAGLAAAPCARQLIGAPKRYPLLAPASRWRVIKPLLDGRYGARGTTWLGRSAEQTQHWQLIRHRRELQCPFCLEFSGFAFEHVGHGG